ncbi:MAG: Na+/H+ antiporter subunit G [Tabrizicola sp.]
MILLEELAIAALLVAGGIFGLIGSFGLFKLKDPMQRLHAPTKATTIGVGAALVASALDLRFIGGGITWQEILVTLFLMLTAPLSALFMAKAHIFRTIDRSTLPDPSTGTSWATLEAKPDAGSNPPA